MSVIYFLFSFFIIIIIIIILIPSLSLLSVDIAM